MDLLDRLGNLLGAPRPRDVGEAGPELLAKVTPFQGRVEGTNAQVFQESSLLARDVA